LSAPDAGCAGPGAHRRPAGVRPDSSETSSFKCSALGETYLSPSGVRASRGSTVDRGLGLGTNFRDLRLVAGNQVMEIIAVGSVGAERLLIKQAFDAAPQANLIRVILEANRPAHLAVPAASKNHDSSRPEAGGNHSQRPQPARLLFVFTTGHKQRILPKAKDMLNSRGAQWSSQRHESEGLPQLTKEHTPVPTLP